MSASRRIAVAGALAGLALVPTSAAGAAPEVTGGGAGTFPEGPFAGDRVQLNVTASGRFDVVHKSSAGGVFAHLASTLDCVDVDGGSATMTGVITHGYDDFGIDPVGYRISIHVVDGEPDVLGLNVQFLSGDPLQACTGSPLFLLPVSEGGFTLRS